jgi:hypothetical protein
MRLTGKETGPGTHMGSVNTTVQNEPELSVTIHLTTPEAALLKRLLETVLAQNDLLSFRDWTTIYRRVVQGIGRRAGTESNRG